jgi:hypothetical protein
MKEASQEEIIKVVGQAAAKKIQIISLPLTDQS